MSKNTLFSKKIMAASVVCALAAGTLSSGASAQIDTQVKKRKTAAQVLLEEVLVVARKKSAAENVQDVPLAITAYGSEQLEALFVKDLTDLSFTTPNVQLDEVGTFPGVQNFSIRGQGINSSIPSVDPTVGTVVDGVFLGVTYGVVMDMFDIESIEVLRGPQGLLFGRNVTGGAVLIRTARPDGEFDFKVRTRVSTGPQYNVAAAIEGALTDSLAAKVVGYYDKDEGYFESTANAVTLPGMPAGARSNPAKIGGDAGERENQFIRTAFVWTPSDEFNLTVLAETGKMDGDGPVWTNRELWQNGSADTDETQQDELGFVDMEWDQLILEANWDVANGTVTNIMGWRDLEMAARSDIDSTSLPIFNAPGPTDQDQFSNELRYSGTFMDGKWDVTAGLYYFTQDISYRENRWVYFPPLINTLANVSNLGGDMDHETWALFLSNDYNLTDTLTVTAGLRYTREEKEADVIDLQQDPVNFPCQGDPVGFSNCLFVPLDDEWSNVTPKLGVDWQLQDNLKLYAFYTKGFRSGGVNFRNALSQIIDPGPTKEEEQDHFEIGFKSDLMDARLRLNGAVFYDDISDMQRELNVGASDLLVPVGTSGVMVWQATANVGDVSISGAELDFVAVVTDNFSLNGSLGYLHSEYDSYSDTIQQAEQLVGITLIGTDLPRLSPWTASLGATYDISLGDAGFLTLRGGYSYRDPAAYNDSNTAYFESKRMASASINWSSVDAHWKASLFGKNLNDEPQWGSLNVLAPGLVSGAQTKGRVYGLELQYNY